MTPVIIAAMSKLIKVVGSLSYFHAESVQRDSFNRDETSRQLPAPREKKKGSELFGHRECRFHDDSFLRDENFTSTASKIYGYVTSRRKLRATVSEAERKIDIFIEVSHTLG